MNSDEVEYGQQYLTAKHEIELSQFDLTLKLKGKRPMHKSVWWKSMKKDRLTNKQFNRGQPLASTLFSGGTVHCGAQRYRASLVKKARDLDNGVILTDNEFTHNSIGTRVFFEFDYRSVVRLPTLEERKAHISTTQKVVAECFPSTVNTFCVFMTSNNKLKTKAGKTMLAAGSHVVFPYIVATTPELKCMAQILDSRISSEDPFWNSIVDAGPYKSETASLRPIFSFKMQKCPCTTKNKEEAEDDGEEDEEKEIKKVQNLPIRKRKRSLTRTRNGTLRSTQRGAYKDYCQDAALLYSEEDEVGFFENLSDDSDLEISSWQPGRCGECFNGRIIAPSLYTIDFFLHKCGTFESFPSPDRKMTTLQQLELTSIVPGSPSEFTTGFTKTLDDNAMHVVPRGVIVFKSGCRDIRAMQRRKGVVRVSSQVKPKVFELLRGIISRICRQFEKVVVHTAFFDESRKSIIVNVKGEGSQFCILQNREHGSSRFFVCFYPSFFNLSVSCYHPDCKKELNAVRAKNRLKSKFSVSQNNIVNLMSNTKLKRVDKMKISLSKQEAYEIAEAVGLKMKQRLSTSITTPIAQGDEMTVSQKMISPLTGLLLSPKIAVPEEETKKDEHGSDDILLQTILSQAQMDYKDQTGLEIPKIIPAQESESESESESEIDFDE